MMEVGPMSNDLDRTNKSYNRHMPHAQQDKWGPRLVVLSFIAEVIWFIFS
jgi:hypothetical protein